MAKSMEAKFRARIARKALKEVGQDACSRKTNKKKGYFTSCHSGSPGGPPELWCSDFARWVWWKAGAAKTGPKMGASPLNAESGTFGRYGKLRRKPRVGDAVLFGYNGHINKPVPKNPDAQHVAIVVEVNSNGTIRSVSGDLNGESGSNAHFAATSSVVHDLPYSSKIGSSDPNAPNNPVSGYVSPVENVLPYSRPRIINMVKEGVAEELRTELGHSGVTPAQGAKAAVKAKDTVAELRGKIDALTNNVETLANNLATLMQQLQTPAPPAKGAGPVPNGGTRRRRAGSRTPR
jgi:hypothetical protein